MAGVLIVGGAGFIGSHLARKYLECGEEVHVLVREESPLARLAPLRGQIRLHKADLRDIDALRTCFRAIEPERVFHLAGSARVPPSASMHEQFSLAGQDNENFMNVLAALSGLKKPPEAFVRAGSLAEYGDAPPPCAEEEPAFPVTPYGAGHLYATNCLRAMRETLPFWAASARLALVYGPSQAESFFVPMALQRCMAGKTFAIRAPESRRDLMHVDDAADGLMALCAKRPPDVVVLNLCTGVAPTMIEAGAMVLEAVQASPDSMRIEPSEREARVDIVCGCPALAERTIGWRAKISLADGLKRLARECERGRLHRMTG